MIQAFDLMMTQTTTIRSDATRRKQVPAAVRLLGIVALGFLGLEGPTAEAQQPPPTSLPVIVADFNHDGIPDVLIPSLTTPTATIAFGTVPFGTFSPNVRALTLPGACQSTAGPTVVGDFNQDGFTDIVFDCGLTAGVAGVMLGRGDGTFAPAQSIQGVTPSTSAVVGDFNHDGKLDIVTLGTQTINNTSREVLQFFAGNGDGTFAAGVTTTLLSGASYATPIAADVNGDGYPDIVLGSFAAGSVPTLAVFGNNKDGTFGSIAGGGSSANASTAVGTASNSNNSGILVGSFFARGSVDFAVPDLGTTPGVFLVRNTSTTTSFSLAAAAKTPYPALSGALAGSFTGSGFSDLLVGNAATQSVLANDGSGNFAATYTNLTISTTTSGLAAADANGDGYADVYSATQQAGGGIQVIVDQVTGSATATSQPFSLPVGIAAVGASWPGNALIAGSSAAGTQTVQASSAASATTVNSSENPSRVGDTVTLTATVAGPVGTTRVPTGVVTMMDGTAVLGSGSLGDSGVFALQTASLAAGTHSITVSYPGDANFASSVSPVLMQVVNAATVTPPATTTTLALTSGGGAVSTVVSGSVVTLSATVLAAGTAVNPGQVRFCDAASAACTDIHLLGTAQLTAAGTAVLRFVPGPGAHNYKAVFVGTGTTAGSASAATGLTVTATLPATTTIAQSGSLGNYTLTATVAGTGAVAPTGTVSFLDQRNGNAVLGTGPVTGAVSALSLTAGSSYATGREPSFVAVGDFNNDGKPDMAISNAGTPGSPSTGGTVTILLGQGDGTFAAGTSVAVGSSPGSIIVGDFNGDGNADLAVTIANGTAILLGNGTGAFTNSNTVSAPGGLLASGDFNGDGILDLASTNGDDDTVSIALGNGDGSFTIATGPFITGNAAVLVTGDFDGDGKVDLAIGTAGGAVQILLGNGDGTFTTGTSLAGTSGGFESALVADFNGDGKLDLLGSSATQNGIVLTLFPGNGDGSFGAGVTTTVPGSGPVDAYNLSLGDFNGDGKPDVVIGDFVHLNVLLNDGSGAFTVGASAPGASGDPDSYVNAVADFNGDGIPDIVTGNSDLDEVAILLTAATQTVTATATGVSPVGAGAHPVVASYPGDGVYERSVSAPTSIDGVTSATTLTWVPAVSTVAYGTALGSDQLDAVATGPGGMLVPGTYVYTPAAGTVLPPGMQTLNVAFTPTDAAAFSGAAGSVQITVTGLSLVSVAPAVARVGDGDTVVTLAGSGFVPSSTVQVNGAAIATAYVNPTTLTAVVPAANFVNLGTLQVTVADPSIGAVSLPQTITVVPASPIVTFSGPSTTPPGSQPALAFTIVNPYPVDLTATLTLAFAGSANPPVDDPAIQFASGGRTLTFIVPANSTTVPPIQLQAGTDAGTITIPLKLVAEGVDVTPTTLAPLVITVPAAVPVASTVTVTRSGDELSVAIHGFSNTRELTQATFHFAAAAGQTIDTPDVTADVGRLFTNWYSSDQSVQVGSTFTYTQIFNVSGDAANVGQVTVTLTNSVGASTSVTSQ